MHATLVAAALIALTSAAHAAPPAKQIATVNGKPIPQARFETIMNSQTAQGQPDTPQLRDAIKERLIRIELLAQEAEKKGMDKKPEVASQIAMTRQDVLIGAYLQDYVKAHPVTDAMIKAEYDNLKKTLGEKEYKARHILVEGEDEAKAIIGKLKADEKFEELAKQSKDPGSKERGGDLGWANKAAYVKPFSDAMAALEKGKTTETPVKSDFGYHVIQLEDVRDMKAPTMDEIKPQLTQRLQQQMIEKHITDLRAKAKVQ
ncbi:MAG: peptidylprolyl isomerase [Rhodocyclales bacterium]|nr:peptidylprolyl isomerase [Rhodocyclales bacterium]